MLTHPTLFYHFWVYRFLFPAVHSIPQIKYLMVAREVSLDGLRLGDKFFLSFWVLYSITQVSV
jgi:hypothetical protein